MKLYRVIEMDITHYKSFLDPGPDRIEELPTGELEGISGYGDAFRMLRDMGYSDFQAGKAIALWCQQTMASSGCSKFRAMEHARAWVFDMHHAATAPMFPPVVYAYAVILGIVVIAVILVNPTWDVEKTREAPDRMYFMTYEERAWCAELYGVTYYGQPYYERTMNLDNKIVAIAHNQPFVPDVVDHIYWLGTVVTGGRHGIYYHRYVWKLWRVDYIGLLTDVGNYIYTPRRGVRDPYLPNYPWWRPGGNYGTREYQGIYTDWPWWDLWG